MLNYDPDSISIDPFLLKFSSRLTRVQAFVQSFALERPLARSPRLNNDPVQNGLQAK